MISLRWLLLLCVVIAMGWPTFAAQPVKARTATPGKPATPPPDQPVPPAVSEELVFIKSVFEDGPKAGKDPFFPNSTRITATRSPTNNVVPELPDLVLRGISVNSDKRTAMINTYTLEAGEEVEIKVGSKVYRIKCLEIREKSVLINYKGLTKELALRQGW